MFGKNKFYLPLYNKSCVPSCNIPDIYNAEGRKMDVFFLRDIHSAHDPHGDGSKYFIWDRYNYGLKTHFYTHRTMLETMGKPDRKYGMLIETPAIVPKDYQIFDKHRGIEREFDAIFTYDEKLLNDLSNAKFFPGCAGIWYGRRNGKIINPEQYKEKEKNISIVSSEKTMCDLHKVRLELARVCKKNKIADTYGTFDGGEYVSIETSLKEYRYSIVIENYISDYFFTERLTNCFASQTIPIYLGARKIEQFFNSDGIICLNFKEIENIENILRICTKEEYERRLPAVLDNYKEVQKYNNVLDYLYEQYF